MTECLVPDSPPVADPGTAVVLEARSIASGVPVVVRAELSGGEWTWTVWRDGEVSRRDDRPQPASMHEIAWGVVNVLSSEFWTGVRDG